MHSTVKHSDHATRMVLMQFCAADARGASHQSCVACRKKKGASELSDDNLNAHNHLQAAGKAPPANDMVFISPMDYEGVKSVLEDHSAVDPNLPFELDKMPHMPQK